MIYMYTHCREEVVAVEFAGGIRTRRPINNMLVTILTVIDNKSLYQIHSLYTYAHAYVNSV